jgi:hypothetical protein
MLLALGSMIRVKYTLKLFVFCLAKLAPQRKDENLACREAEDVETAQGRHWTTTQDHVIKHMTPPSTFSIFAFHRAWLFV